MNSFRDKIMRFMYGRYGFDQFGRFLFILALVFWALCFVVRFTPFISLYYVFSAINTIIYIYAIFRILSKNIVKRAQENEGYLRVRAKLMPKINKATERIKDSEHFFKKCPHCGAKLRLKRIRGKHTTKCPRCGTKFTIHIWFGDKM